MACRRSIGWSVATSIALAMLPAAQADVGPIGAYIVAFNLDDDLTPVNGERFGSAVAADGNGLFVVGAPFDDNPGAPSSGTVFALKPGSLNPRLVIPAPEPHGGDQFGSALASDGTRLLVGAPFADEAGTDAGAAYLFTIGSIDAPLVWKSVNPAASPGDRYGAAVAIVGNELFAVGAPASGREASGAVYLLNLRGEVVRTLHSPQPSAGDLFGYALATDGSDVLVGAPFDDSGAEDTGAVYVFDGDPDRVTFGQLRRVLRKSAPKSADAFGTSVRSFGGTIYVGAPLDDTAGEDAGAVYAFASGSTDPRPNPLVSPTPQGGSAYGTTLAPLDDTTVAVGAPLEDGAAADTGAVYLHQGSLARRLTRAKAASFDRFGAALAGSDGDLVVGTPGAAGSNGLSAVGTVAVFAGTCGNCQLDSGEGCDDGRHDINHGCTDDCRLTPGFSFCDSIPENCLSCEDRNCSICFTCPSFSALVTTAARDVVSFCNCGETQGQPCRASECGIGTCQGSVCANPVSDPDLPGVCDDDDKCTEDVCNPSVGCIHNAKNCNDHEACTNDRCDTATGTCANEETDCECRGDAQCNAQRDLCDGIRRCGECPGCEVIKDQSCCGQKTCRPPALVTILVVGAACSDLNDCTEADRCDANRHCASGNHVTGFPALLCDAVPACGGPSKLLGLYHNARAAIVEAQAATAPQPAIKLLKRSIRRLGNTKRALGRARRRQAITFGCATEWRDLIVRNKTDTKALIPTLRGS